MRRSVLVLVGCVSCGPGIQTREDTARTGDRFLESVATRDVASIATHFGPQFAYGGMYFASPDCLQKFPVPAVIQPAKHADFAACLATLMLTSSRRTHEMYNVVIYEYAPGIEIEAKFEDLGDGPKLTWIGYAGRRGLHDGLPTIARSLLESARTEGDPNGTPSPEDAAKLAAEPSRIKDDNAWAWLKVCVSSEGAITNVHPREASTPLASRVFTDVVQTWKFKPISLGGSSPMPACALLRLSDPPLDTPEKLPVPFVLPANAFRIASSRIERISGSPMIAPEDEDKLRLMRRGIASIVGAFGYCVDETGAVTDISAIESTGLPSYDAKILATIKSTWKYKPYVYDGKATKVCTTVAFVYRQR